MGKVVVEMTHMKRFFITFSLYTVNHFKTVNVHVVIVFIVFKHAINHIFMKYNFKIESNKIYT